MNWPARDGQECSCTDDDWGRLAPHFAPAAEREVLGGGTLAYHSVGRDELIADLRCNVEDMCAARVQMRAAA